MAEIRRPAALRRSELALGRFLDVLAAGRLAAPVSAHDEDLDPKLAATVRLVHELAGQPLPESKRAELLWRELMNIYGSAAVAANSNGHHSSNGLHPSSGAAYVRVAPPARHRRRATATLSFVAATALIAAAMGLLFTLYQDHRQSGYVPALTEQVATPDPLTSWPMYRGNPARTGAHAGPGVEDQPSVLWTFSAGSSSAAFAPAIAEGIVYLQTEPGELFAIDANTGAVLWQTTGSYSMPSVSGKLVYAISENEELVALDTVTHEAYWRASPASPVWTPLVSDGVLYYGADANLLVARDAESGSELWLSEQSGVAARSAALDTGVLVVGGEDQFVYGIDAATGKTLWRYELGDGTGVIQTPAIADGIAFVGTFAGSQNAFAALDLASGIERWRVQGIEGESFYAAAVAGGLVYVPSDSGALRALDTASGQMRWTYQFGEAMRSAPAIVDGVVYAAGTDGILLAFDAATGGELWRMQLDGFVDFGPVVVGGRLYVGTGSGTLYAIAESDAPASVTAPTEAPIEATPAAAGSGITVEHIWTLSKEQGAFGDRIAGFATDPFGRLRVCDGGDGSLVLFDRDGNQLSRIAGGLGSAPGQWNWDIDPPGPGWTYKCGIAFSPDGTAYITDGGNARVQILDPSGTLIGGWGTAGDKPGELLGPSAIAMAPNGDILIVDFTRIDIQRFTPDGTFVSNVIPGDGADGKPFDPINVLFDDDGNLWITELATSRVVKMAPDGRVLLVVGADDPGGAPGQLREPEAIAFDEAGNVYVSDQDNRRVQIFDSNGNFIAHFNGSEAGIARFGEGGGGVADIVYGGNGYLYVQDFARDDMAAGEERVIKLKVTLPQTGGTPTP